MAGLKANALPLKPSSRDDFRIAIVCALEIESTAVAAVFDQRWDSSSFDRVRNDQNEYTHARIGHHNVVLAYLPGMGSNAAAASISTLQIVYPNIELAFLVGICGGVPQDKDAGQIFLGDVIISQNIVQYDYGSRYPHKLKRKDGTADSLPRHGPRMRSFLHRMRTAQETRDLTEKMCSFLDEMTGQAEFTSWKFPSPTTDLLFQPTYRHKHQKPGVCDTCDECTQNRDETCEEALKASCFSLGCDEQYSILRDRTGQATDQNSPLSPKILFGTVASANQVMKSAIDRIEIAEKEGAIAFEMEGAGLWDYIPTLIIKSVCDYADSHKNKEWQKYASAAAASCMKALLEKWTSGPLYRTQLEHDRSHFQFPSTQRNMYFTGREDILAKLDAVLVSTKPGPRVAVLHGLGGQGKTQIALEYCHRKQETQYECIIWLDASSRLRLLASFEAAVELFRMPSDELSSPDAKVAFVLRKLAWRSSSWLMVFDNYDEIDEFNALDYFPRAQHGSILVTSRNTGTCSLAQDHVSDFIELEGLDDDSAVSLLLQQSGMAIDSDNNRKDAVTVVKRLGNHPLAIFQTAPFLKRPGNRLDNFLDYFERQKRRILKDTKPKLSQYRRKLSDSEDETVMNVFTTWELSFQQLEAQTSQDGIETRFITLLSLFDHKNIPELLFRAFPIDKFRETSFPGAEILCTLFREGQWDHDLFVDVIKSIAELSLLQLSTDADSGTCRIRLHPLIKDWIRLRHDPETLVAMCPVVPIVLGSIIFDSWGNGRCNLPLEEQQLLFSHILAHETNVEEWGQRIEANFDRVASKSYLGLAKFNGCLAQQMGFYSTAEAIFKRVLSRSSEVLGVEDPTTLTSMARLASTYLLQGKLNEAEMLQVQDMEISEAVLGREHPHTLSSIYHLASIYSKQGKWSKAETFLIQVTEIFKRVLGEEHRSTLASMGNLASTYLYQGRWSEAETLQAQVLEIRRRVLGEEHPSTLISMGNLASIYDSQNRLSEAETLEAQVMELSRRVLGEEHPSTLASMGNLASIYQSQNRLSEAETLQAQVMEIRRRVLGEEHPDMLTSMGNLAMIFYHQERLHEAEELLLKVVKTRRRVLGEQHFLTVRSIEALKAIRAARGVHEGDI